METFLHVGCDSKRKDCTAAGFAYWSEECFESNGSVQSDLVRHVTDISSVFSDSLTEVFASHNLVLLLPHKVPFTLSDFLRVLDTVVGLAKEEMADCGRNNFGRLLKPLAIHQFTNCSSKRKTRHMLGVRELWN